MLTTIGFDADDTLWQNEAYFRLTQDRFARDRGNAIFIIISHSGAPSIWPLSKSS